MCCLCSDPKGKKDSRKKSSSLLSQSLSVAMWWHESWKESTQPFTCVSSRERCPVPQDITSQYFIMYIFHWRILDAWKHEGNQKVQVKKTEKVFHLVMQLRVGISVVYLLIKTLKSKNVSSLNSLKRLQCCSQTAGSPELWGNHTKFSLKQRLHKSLELHTLIQWKTNSRTHLCLHWFKPHRYSAICDFHILFLCKSWSFYLQCTWATNKF